MNNLPIKSSRRMGWLPYILLCLVFLSMQVGALAMNNTYSFSYQNELIESVIQNLEEETGYSFAYQSDILPANYRITKSFSNKTIESILTEVLHGTGIIFHIVDEQIILKKDPKPKTYTLSGYLNDAETGQRLINAHVHEKVSNIGVITNNYGYYSLSLPEGVYNLVYSYIGMEPIEALCL